MLYSTKRSRTQTSFLTGQISIPELRFAMTSMGEKLDEDDVDEMTLEGDPRGTGQIDCAKFAALISQ